MIKMNVLGHGIVERNYLDNRGKILMSTKVIDPIDVKRAIQNGQLIVYCSEQPMRETQTRWIYLQDIQTGDTVKIGEVNEL